LLRLPAEIWELQILSALYFNREVDAHGIITATDTTSPELLII
jgi:hypothetical protein